MRCASVPLPSQREGAGCNIEGNSLWLPLASLVKSVKSVLRMFAVILLTMALPGESETSETARYSLRSITRSEFAYGSGFQGPGGLTTTTAYAKQLPALQSGNAKVLDVGCGLGGASHLMATAYCAEVHGIDLSENMVQLARQHTDAATFAVGSFLDPTCFPKDTYDLVWCLDSILYAEDKGVVMRNFYNTLKSGGTAFITDFGRRAGDVSQEYTDYCRFAGYFTDDLECYRTRLLEAGFKTVDAVDQTDLFIELNKADLSRLLTQKTEFLERYSEMELQHLVTRWERKIAMSEEGSLRWFKFTAVK